MTNINEATGQHVEQIKPIETAISSINSIALSLSYLIHPHQVSEGNRPKA
jgi:hypothetical protein